MNGNSGEGGDTVGGDLAPRDRDRCARARLARLAARGHVAVCPVPKASDESSGPDVGVIVNDHEALAGYNIPTRVIKAKRVRNRWSRRLNSKYRNSEHALLANAT